MINWKVRIRNKSFWVAFIPAIALVVQAVASVFGWTLNFDEMTGKILTVVDAVFALLVILGVVVDPTTDGIGDSIRAMGYEEPWKDGDGGAANAAAASAKATDEYDKYDGEYYGPGGNA